MIEEDIQIVNETIDSGFVNESRVIGVAYSLDKLRSDGVESSVILNLEKRFKQAVYDSGFERVLDNQIDYYLTLSNYDGELLWEEKEKISELEKGISKMLGLGFSCDEKFEYAFSKKMKIKCVRVN